MSYDLTPQEVKILLWKFQGLSGKDIAKKLDIANSTLSKYMAAICRKLGVATKAAAIYQAKQMFPSMTRRGLSLTPREQEIFSLLVCDLTTEEVAQELRISIGSVNNRIHEACSRAGATDRDHLIAILPLSKLR